MNKESFEKTEKENMPSEEEAMIEPEEDTGASDHASEEVAQLKDQLLRTMAELENLRKRTARETEEAHKYAIAGFCKGLLTVVDTLDRALESVPEDQRSENAFLKTMCEGVDLTRKEFSKVFSQFDVEKINPKEEPFDHNLHQAVSEVPHDTLSPGMVVDVLQAGYKIGDRLLRPAMVTVAKKD